MGFSSPFPGKNTAVGCHSLFQCIFLTQGSNPCLRHWQVDSLPLSHLGSPHQMVFRHAQSCPTLYDPIDCSLQAPLSMRFPRQEYWSGLPFPPLGDLPNQGIKPESPGSPALAARFFTSEPHGNPTSDDTDGFICWSLRINLEKVIEFQLSYLKF